MAENLSTPKCNGHGDGMDDDDWPVPEQSNSINPLLTPAKESYINKDYDKALKLYHMVLQGEKGTSDNSKYAYIKALYMISRCHMEMGNYDQALACANHVCDHVMSHCPENIHIPERLIIEIWQQRGDILNAFILAIIFKELRPLIKESDVILSGIQSKLEQYLTKELQAIEMQAMEPDKSREDTSTVNANAAEPPWEGLPRALEDARDQLQNKVLAVQHYELKLTDSIPGVELKCNTENPHVQLTAEDFPNKVSYTWEFCVRFKVGQRNSIPNVCLQCHRQHFHISRVEVAGFHESNRAVIISSDHMDSDHYQPPLLELDSDTEEIEFQVEVTFQAWKVFGSFVQRILFDFGREPWLAKEFNIDIGTKDTLERLRVVRQEVCHQVLPWDDRDSKIIRCKFSLEKERLMSIYCLPKDAERIVSVQLIQGEVREDTYKQTMHQLLFAEEVHMRNLLLRLTPTSLKLHVMTENGFLHGSIDLNDIEITPDDVVGRLCLRNVQSVFILPRGNAKYICEAAIIRLESRKVFVNLTPRVCNELMVQEGSVVNVHMRFNLNRAPHCVMHKAIDSLGPDHIRQLFPVEDSVHIKKGKAIRKGMKALDPRLNESQKRVIRAIAQAVPPSPPLVVFGPFGTGKTFTLNQAVIYLMKEKANRVLLCTHTNSAADIHLELLDEYLCRGDGLTMDAETLRVYNPEMELKKTSDVARKYALIKNDIFLMPTRKDIIDHRVVITTLTSANLLTKLNGVQQGFFTHILIDEAAQAWETEALIPLALAGPNTKIVFTGDHMQMDPEVYSTFARGKGLHKSLPQRLFDQYERASDSRLKDNNVMFLFENYRSNKNILDFPSKHCYKGQIIAKGHEENPCHPEMGSLSFHTAKGQDEKQSDNTYVNVVEVDKVVKLIVQLDKNWPPCWGQKNLQQIGVVAPYRSQVRAIRDRLRAKRLGSVNVETIHNVQGKEFRAVFISTVRTNHSIATLCPQNHCDDLWLEFLSDPKLFITAVTRAKSLVAVVGDPNTLCTVGRCRSLWRDYISTCSELQGLHGTTWTDLTREIKDHPSNISLNPQASSFVPEGQSNEETNDNAVLHSDSPPISDLPSDTAEDTEANSILGDEGKITNAFINALREKKVFESSGINAVAPRSKKKQTRKSDLESLRCKYLIRRKNKREVIILVDVYDKRLNESDKVVLNSDEQQVLDSEKLQRMVEEDPSRYITARLQIGTDKFRTTNAVIDDKTKADIQVKGSIRNAFDGDTVVIDLKPKNQLAREGNVGFFTGVLNQFVNPRERKYICEISPKNPRIMVPIDGSLPRIVNVTDDKKCKDVPIYENYENGQSVRMLKLQDVLNKKYLFVVEFLKWKNDSYLPLGYAVQAIGRGETLQQSKKILLIHLGIKENFDIDEKEQTMDAKRKFQGAINGRRRITNAFTIDQPESQALDDAISVDDIGGGWFKVGIHIADVSFFVARGTDLDQEARQRGVSYYSRSRPGREGNIPMLPRELTKHHLSLLPDKDRLTVSVFNTLDTEGNVVGDGEIFRTVTRSCCRLSYSEAQGIIDEKDCQARDDIPDEVRKGIQLLHPLAVKRRRQRLKEASLDHSNNKEDSDAHELIEELMILANHTVGDLLHGEDSRGTPFRVQGEPKVHHLIEWATNYGPFAKYSPTLQPQLQSEDITAEVKERISSEKNSISIKKRVWDQIIEAVRSEDHRRVERLICDPFCSPQIATARHNLHKIQCKAQYKSYITDPYHHSLKLRNYVHFTSPIRRYIDIEVHRLLLTLVDRDGAHEHPRLDKDEGAHEHPRLDKDEMDELCRRATRVEDNSRTFERESDRIHIASELSQESHTGIFVIDEIQEHSFTISPVSSDEEHFLDSQKEIKFDDLSPYSKSENTDGQEGTTLMWRFRMYIGPSHGTPRNEDQKSTVPDIENPSIIVKDAESIKTMMMARYELDVHKIDGENWLRIIDFIKKSETAKLLRHVLETNDQMQEKKEKKEKKAKRKQKAEKGKENVYKHPNSGQKNDASKSENDGHFYEIKWTLKQFEMVSVQLFSRLDHGIIHPDDQYFKVSPHFGICLEHRKEPRECFAAHATGQVNSPEVYRSIESYIRRWKPLLEMELATGAIKQNDGFTLKSLKVLWSGTNDQIKGEFKLKESYCNARQIKFHPGDFTCVKILRGSTTNQEKSATSTVIWIGHGLIKSCKTDEKKNSGMTVILEMLQMASEFPKDLLDRELHVCDVEFIYQPLPLRRMNEALKHNLKRSSKLVQQLCLGKRVPRATFPLPDDKDLSLAAHYEGTEFHPLNKYQEEAVKRALKMPATLIQGPPGTGKTVTGVHIAYWYANRNSMEMQPPDTDEEEDSPKAPRQVLYCGPSNKSVDVVTEYLLRIPGMKEKILRVHGTLIEEAEFPIPNKIRISKPTVSEDELKIPGEKVREVSLHHFIRSESSPYSKELKGMEEQFAEAKRNKERPSEEDVAKYCNIIAEAEIWALKESGKEIILCTCSRAGSKTITSGCNNIQQCIIDECGMCMEPEVLVPMTSSEAKQFVLIGDHKQLQPIVTDKRAKSLGLEISMFERLASQAIMLKIQYRMHPSICEFPSLHFYDGKLETPNIVRSRQTANVTIWPANNEDTKVAFCHVEGVEESSVISTAESGVDSKYNKDEARKAAYLAKYLVNKHAQIQRKDVVILTPYRQQRKEIKDALGAAYDDILVTTIIKSQGSEWDYVILSLVRSLPEADLEPEPSSSWLLQHLGFITDDHQINVALTRAKHGLCIIGNKNLLGYDPTWRSLIENYEEKNCVVPNSWPWRDEEYQQFSMN